MRLRRLTAALALSALALSGCSGDTDGDGTSTTSSVKPTVIDPTGSSSSTSTSATSSSASSTSETETDGPPEEARANTKEGAEAFAKWYWEENGSSITDGNTSTWRRYSDESCAVCLESIRTLEDTTDKYGFAKSNPYKVEVIRSAKDEAGTWRVKLNVTFDTYELKKDGSVTAKIAADQYEVNPELARKGKSWVVSDWLMVR